MELKRNGGNGRRSLSVVHGNTLNILTRNGTDRSRVLTATVTLADMADYGAFNAVWDAWIVDGCEPARSVTGGALAVPEYKIKIAIVAAL